MFKTIATVLTIAGGAMLLPVAILPMAGPAQSARVVFAALVDPMALPDGLSIERWDGRVVVLSGVDAAAARKLYSLGALLVYPVRAGDCMSVRV